MFQFLFEFIRGCYNTLREKFYTRTFIVPNLIQNEENLTIFKPREREDCEILFIGHNNDGIKKFCQTCHMKEVYDGYEGILKYSCGFGERDTVK